MPMEVRLRPATVLTIRPKLAAGADGNWALRVTGPKGAFGGDAPEGASTPDELAAALGAVAGASRAKWTVGTPEGLIANFVVNSKRPQPIVLTGVRPGATLRIEFYDPEAAADRESARPRASTTVTLAPGERREVPLAVE